MGARLLGVEMKELIREIKERWQPSSDDRVSQALMTIATFCSNLSDRHSDLVERVTELENKVSIDIRSDIQHLKSDVESIERDFISLQGDVRQLERNR